MLLTLLTLVIIISDSSIFKYSYKTWSFQIKIILLWRLGALCKLPSFYFDIYFFSVIKKETSFMKKIIIYISTFIVMHNTRADRDCQLSTDAWRVETYLPTDVKLTK